MMTVYNTHGLFLTCTQKFYLYIYITHKKLLKPDPACKKIKEPPLIWKADVLLMAANPHPLWSLAW
jgi:hypothetical protein